MMASPLWGMMESRMSVLNKLASALERNDEASNQALAASIAETGDAAAVQELVAHLANPDAAIQSDCIKVLYEIGERHPALIADYVDTFIDLLRSRNNRLVWGAMTALGQIAGQRAPQLWQQIAVVMSATEQGSVITQDWGIRVLAAVAAHDPSYAQRVVPFLLRFLMACPPKDVPRHAESAAPAFDQDNHPLFLSVLKERRPALKPAQAKRIDALIRRLEK
jgi:HEAT repeat protein